MRTEGDPVGYLPRFGIPGGEARKLGPKTIIGTKPCFISAAKTYCERTLHLQIEVSALLAPCLSPTQATSNTLPRIPSSPPPRRIGILQCGYCHVLQAELGDRASYYRLACREF